MHYSPHAHALMMNIAVVYGPQLEAFLGFWIAQRRTIMLKPGLSPRMERCVLAHELGHAAMGHHGHSPTNERWANAYAATTLVEPGRFREARTRYGSHLGHLARSCEVTPEIMREYLEWETLMPFWQKHILKDPTVLTSMALDWETMPPQAEAWRDVHSRRDLEADALVA